MQMFRNVLQCTLLTTFMLPVAGVAQTAGTNAPVKEILQPANYDALVALFSEWRAFERPTVERGIADYSAAAMARKAAALPGYKSRLKSIDTSNWSAAAQNDHKLVQAEMDGFDFMLRVLKPWARDPGYYQTVFGEESDVPAHEGPSASPTIDLFKMRYPLSADDDRKLTILIGAVPAMLKAAQVNLADSNAADLWRYGDRAFKEQSDVLASLERGDLKMRTLEGEQLATLVGASTGLRRAVKAAKLATDNFAAWVAAEAPRKTGPSGIGKADYDWYLTNVSLTPYSWDQQIVLLQRELDRALASLRLEELRNRALPQLAATSDPVAYQRMADAQTERFNHFLVKIGLVPDKPYFRAALSAQTSRYVAPASRNFFSHVTALDPLPLLSHSIHWVELARLKHEPHRSPIRRVAPLFNIFADRSEGLATAMEEIVMQAGLYDDAPRSKELVWIMLANRAARGLASLRVQANEIDLAEAGKFHAAWTPRHWSNPESPLVGFEQLLYLRQPGYGPSYIIGKLQLDQLLARASQKADRENTLFDASTSFQKIIESGILPPELIAIEMPSKTVN